MLCMMGLLSRDKTDRDIVLLLSLEAEIGVLSNMLDSICSMLWRCSVAIRTPGYLLANGPYTLR
jgi:hypothetical protein